MYRLWLWCLGFLLVCHRCHSLDLPDPFDLLDFDYDDVEADDFLTGRIERENCASHQSQAKFVRNSLEDRTTNVFNRRCLFEHNLRRKYHNASALVLSDALIVEAKRRCANVSRGHRLTISHACVAKDHGENLFWQSTTDKWAPPFGCAEAISGWYEDEMRFYLNYKAPGQNDLHHSGHLTQLLWRASCEVGCARCFNYDKKSRMAETYVVCEYKPNGNVLTYGNGVDTYVRYVKNVHPPTYSISLNNLPTNEKIRAIIDKLRDKENPPADIMKPEPMRPIELSDERVECTPAKSQKKFIRNPLEDRTDTQFINDCLSRHNNVRRRHQVPDLKHNPQLGNEARLRCQNVSRGDKLSVGTACILQDNGENLYYTYTMGTRRLTFEPIKNCSDAFVTWYDSEVKNYKNYDDPSKNDLRSTGHFTQLTWKMTQEFGCARCFGFDKNHRVAETYIICEYLPAGNILRDGGVKLYKENVKKPVNKTRKHG